MVYKQGKEPYREMMRSGLWQRALPSRHCFVGVVDVEVQILNRTTITIMAQGCVHARTKNYARPSGTKDQRR